MNQFLQNKSINSDVAMAAALLRLSRENSNLELRITGHLTSNREFSLRENPLFYKINISTCENFLLPTIAIPLIIIIPLAENSLTEWRNYLIIESCHLSIRD